MLGDASAGALNRFVYYFALPALLFLFTARAPVADILNWSFIGAFLLGSVATFAAAIAIGQSVFGHRLPATALFALAAVFPNTAYLGIPLFLTAYGTNQTSPAIVATMTANTVFIAGTIALLEWSTDRTGQKGFAIGLLSKLFLNPLVVAPLLALPIALFDVSMPSPVAGFVELLGSTAGPAALFALGLSFVERRVAAPPVELGAILSIK
ncbi:MAG: AEC family transporter, partial [Pseudomonadota bacterium]